MNIHPSFTILRSNIAYQFSSLRMRALRDLFVAKLTGRNSKLMKFHEQVQPAGHNRKLLAVQDVRVDQIIGTLNRETDFDDQFRPLGKHLLERWVNTFISLQRDEWSPIVVHKLGEQFFVEDGASSRLWRALLACFLLQPMFGNINPSPRKWKAAKRCDVQRDLFQKPMRLDN